MWFKIIMLLLIISLCNGDEVMGRRKKHHHHLYHYKLGILYYLAFLAIKIKIVILIGGAIMGFAFFGKLFALIKYGSHFLAETKREPEKVYIEKPYHEFSHNVYHEDNDFPKFSDHDHPSDRISGRQYSINDDFRMFLGNVPYILRKFNVTEMTFKSLGIVEDKCKRRVVCQANEQSKVHLLMKPIFWLLNDTEFNKYETGNIDDCKHLYGECIT